MLCRQAFAPLVEAGIMEVVYGGAEEGEKLCTHPLISTIHLTGSAATYNMIVWGKDNPNKVCQGILLHWRPESTAKSLPQNLTVHLLVCLMILPHMRAFSVCITRLKLTLWLGLTQSGFACIFPNKISAVEGIQPE